MTRPIVGAVDPRILTGLQGWVRADDILANDGAGQTWVRDHSGKSNGMIGADTNPIFNQNYLGYPAWQFCITSVTDFHDFRGSRHLATINTVWMMLAHTAATFDTTVNHGEGAFNSLTYSGAWPNIISLSTQATQLTSGANKHVYIDGHDFGLNTVGDFANANIVAANGDMTNKHLVCVTDSTGYGGDVAVLGRSLIGGTNGWVGYGYEAVWMTGVPDALTRAAIDTYFATKYGINLVA